MASNALQKALMQFLDNPDETEFYQPYNPQIVMTNELYQIFQTKNYIKPNSDILTVCGAGEQPLFFKLWGAKNVLTFDISCHSHLMMSLKVAALQEFKNSEDYSDFFCNLYSYAPWVSEVPNMQRVMSRLDTEQQKYIIQSSSTGFQFCLSDPSCDFYKIPLDEYKGLRQSVKEPFPFIWTDIKELDHKLGDTKFDTIYYSNICEFLKSMDQKAVLENTKKHLKDNGTICLVSNYSKFYDALALCSNTFRRPAWNINPYCAGAKSFCHIAITKSGNSR